MAVATAKQVFTRKQVRRLLKITERQLASWERQQLIARSELYGFKELLALRTLIRLRAARRPVAQIARALDALHDKLGPLTHPLTDLRIYADGRRIRVEIGGSRMEAESGQLLLDFDQGELNRLLEFRLPDSAAAERSRRAGAERWFQHALELERSGAPVEQVMAAYHKALALDPRSAGSLVNLGTLHFNARQWKEAERCYLQALEADPDYALAHFDLANLYDERGDRAKAIEHYQAALRASPNYADAHYNLALLYQSCNQPLLAVRHWNAYLKLDGTSHWANIARRELAKLRQSTVVPGSGS